MTKFRVRISTYDPETTLNGPDHDVQYETKSPETAVLNAVYDRIRWIGEQQRVRPEFTAPPMTGVAVSLADQEEGL